MLHHNNNNIMSVKYLFTVFGRRTSDGWRCRSMINWFVSTCHTDVGVFYIICIRMLVYKTCVYALYIYIFICVLLKKCPYGFPTRMIETVYRFIHNERCTRLWETVSSYIHIFRSCRTLSYNTIQRNIACVCRTNGVLASLRSADENKYRRT